MTTQSEKAFRLQALHEREGAFLAPNPWDIGSAKLLAGMGFEALATTSAGFALSRGKPDGAMSRSEVIEHCRELCAAVDLPVTADLENGFGEDLKTVAETITLAAEAGLAGASIEDYTGDPAMPFYDIALAAERVGAAVEAARSQPFPFAVTARAENHFRGHDDLDDTIARLRAFEAAGADVLYAPGLKTLEEVRRVADAVGRPLNVLAPPFRGVTLDQLAAAGARRVSVGGALARAAVAGLLNAAREMRERGGFEWVSAIAPGGDIARLLGKD